MKEFKKLLSDSKGNEKEVFALLIKQLNYVKVLKDRVYTADGNEIIKYLDREYYSLHLSGKNFNLRLLMTFDKEKAPIFLRHFMSVQGKGLLIIRSGKWFWQIDTLKCKKERC